MKIKEHSGGKMYLQACDIALRLGRQYVEEISCTLLGRAHYLTRFANNQIIQNVRKNEVEFVVKVAIQGKIGMASCNQLDEKSIEKVVQKAVQLAELNEADPFFQGFASPEDVSSLHGYDEATSQVTPVQMADQVRIITEKSKGKGLESAGACQVEITEQVVGNSRGIRLFSRQSKAELHTVVMSDTSSGYASDIQRSFDKLNAECVADIAIQKCEASRSPITIEIGEYPVILEPKAVADLILYLSYVGWNPDAYHEGRSFLSGKLGEKVLHESLTIQENSTSTQTIPSSFDWDGKPKKVVTLIENGIAKEMIYDDYTGKKYGFSSTGNAVFPTERSYGVLPTRIEVQPGSYSTADMIKQVKKGILITRFHYLGMIHPKQTIVTGMTRDGTFLIEEGKIVGACRNLRFTQSIVEALSQINGIGNEQKLYSAWASTCLTPSLWLEKFRFTGVTEH